MKSNLIFLRTIFAFLFICITAPLYTFADNNQSIGGESVSFFDGSSLVGGLLKVEKERDLVWRHKSSQNPLSFEYKAVESVLFNRTLPGNKSNSPDYLLVKLTNDDIIRGTLVSLDSNELVFSTRFDQAFNVKLSDLTSIEFLPDSYQVFYDSSHEFKKWKKSNSKAWTEEQGSLLSVFSGSTGTTLPELDAIEVSFEAEWQRSFYLALRFFSDSDGGSYGSEGYHLSFSNNRINLQSNKKVKGRTVRDTLGSVTVKQLVGVKKANFKIFAHRKKKEFIVLVNGSEVVRWKDSSPEDRQPKNNGLLLINQGGNSYLRLADLTIAGWSGDSFSNTPISVEKDAGNQIVYFKNGDSTPVISSSSTKTGLLLETKRGTFEVPFENIRSVFFPTGEANQHQGVSNERISLKSSLGKLSFDLDSIGGKLLHGKHPSLGKFQIPLYEIKRLHCNLLLKTYNQYLENLKLAEIALKEQKPEKAVGILENTNSYFRCWYWNRLKFLAGNTETRETLWLNPHPEIGIAKARLLGDENNTIFTNAKDGAYALWDGEAKLAEGKFTQKNSAREELGRIKNEKLKKIFITQNFWLGKTEVTQEQFEKITGTNPSKTKGPNLPVQLSWIQAMDFCKAMNKKFTPPEGLTWRLPTESEWEYCSRAGSTGPYHDTNSSQFPNDEQTYEQHLDKFGWYKKNSDGQVQPVAQKLPNSWGLYDMHGNIWEWCLDGTTVNKGELFAFPKFGANNPLKIDGNWKVLRGGSYNTDYSRCRSAYRGANAPTISIGDRGLRICLGPLLPITDSNKSQIASSKKGMNKKIEALSPFPLQSISPGAFLMGSPSSSNFPEAICDLQETAILGVDSTGKFNLRRLASTKTEWEIDLNGSTLKITPFSTKKHLLIGTDAGRVYLLDRDTKKIIMSYHDHQGPISCIAIDGDEQNFVTCGLDGRVVFRNLEKKDPVWALNSEDYEGDIEYLEFSKDSKNLLASGLFSSVMVMDSKNGKLRTIFPRERGIVLKAKWLPQKNYLCMLNQNGSLGFIELKSGAIYKVIRSNLPSAIDFEFSKDGKRILITTEKGSCSLREIPNDSSILIIRPDGKVETTPDFYFALSKQKYSTQMELNSFLKRYSGNTNIRPADSLTLSPNKKQIATVHDGALRLWSKQTGLLTVTIAEKLSSAFVSCSFSKDGKILRGKLESGHQLFYPTDQTILNYTTTDPVTPILDRFEK